MIPTTFFFSLFTTTSVDSEPGFSEIGYIGDWINACKTSKAKEFFNLINQG